MRALLRFSSSVRAASSRVLLIPSILALAACNGSGTSTQTPTPLNLPTVNVVQSASFTDPASTAASDLAAVTLNAGTRSTSASTGSLDRSDNTASFAGLSGVINAERTLLMIATGGQASLTPEEGKFASRYSAAPQGAASSRGIVGVSTPAADMPGTGLANYTGTTQITAQVGTDALELAGTAAVTATFGPNGQVTTTLSDLSGTRSPALAPATTVSAQGALVLDGAALSGSSFSGGTSSETTDLFELSGAQITSVQGQFYGPGASEVGGTFVIDDSAGGDTLILGDFLVD